MTQFTENRQSSMSCEDSRTQGKASANIMLMNGCFVIISLWTSDNLIRQLTGDGMRRLNLLWSLVLSDRKLHEFSRGLMKRHFYQGYTAQVLRESGSGIPRYLFRHSVVAAKEP